MTGKQRGPVEPGRPAGPVPMDLDVALAVVLGYREGSEAEAATALRGALEAARAYVRGRTPGRFSALCQALQEPELASPPVDVDTVVQAYLTDRDLIIITRDAAERLGVFPPDR